MVTDYLPHYLMCNAERVSEGTAQWAELNFRLPATTTRPGILRLTKPQRGILDIWDREDCRHLTMMMSAQNCKSLIICIILGRTMARNPQSIFFAHPTQAVLERFIREKIRPLIHSSPEIAHIIRLNRNGEVPTDHIDYAGGDVWMGHSGSDSSLSSVAAQLGIFDETDKWFRGGKDADNPLHTAMQRMESFGNRGKSAAASTPVEQDRTLIGDEFLLGTASEFDVPCHHCGVMQVLDDEDDIKDLSEEGADAPDYWYVCPHCETAWTDEERVVNIELGEWRDTNEKPLRGHYSFHMSRMYSPFVTIQEIGEQRDQYGDMTFAQLVMGRPYQRQAIMRPEDEHLAGMMVDDTIEEPEAVTIGCDVQGDRIEWTVLYWRDGYSHYQVVEHGRIWAPTVRERLERVRQLIDDFGADKCYLDRGYLTSELRQEAEFLMGDMLLDGRLRLAKGTLRTPGDVLVAPRGRADRPYDVEVQADGSKMLVHQHASPSVEARTMSVVRAGVYHMPEFWAQIYAEELRRTVNAQTGAVTYRWFQKRRRNEALDCVGYAIGARYELGSGFQRVYSADEDADEFFDELMGMNTG